MKKRAPGTIFEQKPNRSAGSSEDPVSQARVPPIRGQDLSNRTKNVLELSWVDFDRLVEKLARAVRKTFEPEAVVGVAHGGVFVGRAVAVELSTEFYPVRISRRSRDTRTWSTPRLFGEMPRELKGKRILIVDDVASSGDTLQLAHSLAMKAGAKEALTACLVTRAGGYQPGWTALSSADLVVFPWDYQPVTEDRRFDGDPDKAGA